MHARNLKRTAIALLLFAGLSASAQASTTINLWVPWERAFIGQMVQAFNQTHPDIELKLTVAQGIDNNSNGKLTTVVVGGSPPNIILSWDDMIYKWATVGLIQPIDQFAKEAGVKQDDYARGAWEQIQVNGHIYGAPIDWDPDSALFWNRGAFADSGLDPNIPPTYIDQLQSYQQKLSIQQNGRYTRIGFAPMDGWAFNPIYYAQAFGGGFWDVNANAPTLDDPKNVAAYEWLGEWSNQWLQAEQQAKSNGGFAAGHIAMFVGGDWNIPGIRSAAPELDFGISGPPYARDAAPFFPSSGWSWLVPTGADHLKETYEVIDWLNQVEQNVQFCVQIGWLPARLASRSDPRVTADPNLRLFVRAAEGRDQAIWMTPNPIMDDVWNSAVAAAQAVWSKHENPKEAIAQAQTQALAAWRDFKAKHGD